MRNFKELSLEELKTVNGGEACVFRSPPIIFIDGSIIEIPINFLW